MTDRRPEAWKGGDVPPSSRLPAEPAYWERLEARITDEAVAAGAEGDVTVGSARWQPSLRVALGLAASAVLAVVGTLVGTSRPQSEPDPALLAELRSALGPEDPIGRALLSDPSGPAIIELLLVSEGGR